MSIKRGINPGIGFVPAYEISGIPYVTSSVPAEVGTTNAVSVRFPYVTRWVEVVNTGAKPLRIGFSKNGVEGKGAITSGSSRSTSSPEYTPNHRNYFVLNPSGSAGGSTTRLELRCSSIFFLSDHTSETSFSLIAGLTTIPGRDLNLTGSSGHLGIG